MLSNIQIFRLASMATDLDLAGQPALADRLDQLLSNGSHDELKVVNDEISRVVRQLDALSNVSIGSEVTPGVSHQLRQSYMQMRPDSQREYDGLMAELRYLKFARDNLRDAPSLEPSIRQPAQMPYEETVLEDLDDF